MVEYRLPSLNIIMKVAFKKGLSITRIVLVFIMVVLGIDLFGLLRFSIAAQSCPISGVVSSTITLTPIVGDSVIDCSGVDITVASGGEIIIGSYKVSDSNSDNDMGVVLKVQNLTIESGGKVTADGMGYTSVDVDSAGIPADSLGYTGGSGGGYGGAGGQGLEDGINLSPTPGIQYGNAYSPLLLGGAGGNGGDGGIGGNGGGAIKIESTGTVRIDGSLSANGLGGQVGTASAGGGGAGGSIWVDASILAGVGVVEAKGAGTNEEAVYPGGGGGGGRILMFSHTSNNFSGLVSVEPGVTSITQDGGVGSQVGPTTIPNTPTVLEQFANDGATEIATGGVTTNTTVVLSTNLIDADASDTLYVQIELRPLGEAFTNVATHTQSPPLSNPKNCTAGVSYDCGSIVINNLSRNTSYHWQARVRDNAGGITSWVSFGGNTEDSADFIVSGTANVISLESGNSQSGTVGTELSLPLVVKIVDGSGIPSEGYTVTWQVVNGMGGGVFLDGTTTQTNAQGLAQNRYRVGITSGTNTVRAIATGLTGSPITFTLTGIPSTIHHFDISSPQYAIVNQAIGNVTIVAKDIYGNSITNYSGTPTLIPVNINSPYAQLSGTLSPSTATFSSQDTIVISNLTYNTVESMKIQVQDGSAIGRSNSIAIVNSLGSCPDADGIIDTNQTWTADATNKGIFDCSGMNIQVTNSAILTLVSFDSGDTIYTNDFGTTVISSNLTVDSGSKITSDGQGYAAGRGPGAGAGGYCWAKGPSYGGYGNGSSGGGSIYGSVYEPDALGSGSGTQYGGSKGGGAIKLVVSGTTTVNGTISSNGGQTSGDCNTGGSGGSIWIDTNELVGSSTTLITALGKPGNGKPAGGGGGGRVVLYYNTTAIDIPTYVSTGKISTAGASSGGYTSGAGTVYTEQKGVDTVRGGNLLIDNNSLDGKSAGLIEGLYNFKTIRLTRKGHLTILGNNSRLEVGSNSVLIGDSTKPDLLVEGIFSYTGAETLNINGVNLGIKGDITGVQNISMGTTLNGSMSIYANTWAHNSSNQYSFGNIEVGALGIMNLVSYDSGDTNYTNDYGVTINAENITVAVGGTISGTGFGYAQGRGPGVGGGGYCWAKGPSHGGYGNGEGGGGSIYGSVYEPDALGSGTGTQYGGTNGGGAIKLVVSDTLTVNGTIASDGGNLAPTCNTGGAGGSLWIDTNVLTGGVSMSISARGIQKSVGAGGGGRIALYYNSTTRDIASDVSSGKITTSGSSAGGYTSGAGTVYTEQKGVDTVRGGNLLIDNNSLDGKSAGLIQGFYQFNSIKLSRKGHLDVLGNSSYLVLISGSGIVGDVTVPKITSEGTIVYTGSGVLNINGVDLGVKGDIAGVNSVLIGGSQTAGMTLYANTWAHNSSNPYEFGDITVGGLGTMTLVSYDSGDTDYTNDYGTVIEASNLTVDSGGIITANGLGYGVTRGPGAGTNAYCLAKGPSHGGYGNGESGSGSIYGDVYEPRSLGSGTGSLYDGSAGGGAIKLVVSGITTINGTVSADGAPAKTCNAGGSGGSIWVNTNSLSLGANALISAQGKAGVASSGGGRIALYYNTVSIDIPTYVSSGKINTFGANGGGYISGSGTIYTEQKGVDAVKGGNLLVDNNNLDGKSAGLISSSYQFASIKLTREGHTDIVGNDSTLTLSSSSGITGDATVPKITSEGTIVYTGSGVLNINGVDLGVKGDIAGVNSVLIGGSQTAGMTLYANTWAHNSSNPYEFGDITVGGLGTMTLVSYDSGDTDYTNDYGTTITADNITVNTGGKITSDALGYAPDIGPGAGSGGYCWAKGPSHGGYGSQDGDGGNVYGDVYNPTSLGSGSTSQYGGSPGGGSIKLLVSGTTTVDGTISANGGNTSGDCNTGGAGGSILIDTGQLNGGSSMLISARGLEKGAGAGGGGRIGLHYNTTLIDIPIYVSTGKITTSGSSGGGYISGAGTIYAEQKGVDTVNKGSLYIDNSNQNGLYSSLIEDMYEFKNIYLTRSGHLKIIGNASILTVPSNSTLIGDASIPKISAEGTINYTGEGVLDIKSIDLGIMGDIIGVEDISVGVGQIGGLTLYANTWAHNKNIQYTFRDISVGALGTIALVSYDSGDTDYTNDYGTVITAANITVDEGGKISANALGYAPAKGPSAGSNSYCDAIAPSHGGFGSGSIGNGITYGDLYEPITLGSGSGDFYGGTAGGGAIKLLVSGVTTLNGAISADGGNSAGDCSTGGSGGSIWIDTNEFIAGNNVSISAKGASGNGNSRGSSGGGRIALYYNTSNILDMQAYILNGTFNTYGVSSGGYVSGSGTVYVEDKSTYESKKGDLYLENIDRYSRVMDFEGKEYFFNNIYIGGNLQSKILGNTENNMGTVFNLTGDFTLESGAFLDGIGQGYQATLGPGAGNSGTGLSGGAGGAHGGSGGNSFTDTGGTVVGGVFYGNQRQPITLGSGGGNSGSSAIGGSGGGAISILAKQGIAKIFGTINVSGTNGAVSGTEGAGGGAGGSIYIYSNSCDISGVLRANGGDGGSATFGGGGGGGGRLSVLYIEGPCDYQGSTEVLAGVSTTAQSGQVGTFPTTPNSIPYPTGLKNQFEYIGVLGVGDSNVLGIDSEDSILGVGDSSVEVPIPVGGIINGNNVVLKSDILDAGASDLTPKSLKIQVEVKKVGEIFNGATDIFESDVQTYTGGSAITMSVLVPNLDLGASYKWRVRAMNVSTELYSDWKDFGDNNGGADFTITEVERIELQSSDYELELGQKADLRITVYDMYDQVSEQYGGELTITVNSEYGNLLVNSVQYETGIAAIMDITNAVYFTKAGTYQISAYDSFNSMLVDTITITVLPAENPVLTLFVSRSSITEGESVTITWVSEEVTDLVLSYNGINRNVDGLNRVEIELTETTKLTLEGKDKDGNSLKSEATVTVIPKVITEEGEPPIDKEVEENVQQGGGKNDGKFDNKFEITEEMLETTSIITSGLVTLTFVIRFIIDSSWRLFTIAMSFLKKRRKSGEYCTVYDSVTKSPINGAIVRISKEDGSLVKTVVTDIFGMFDADLESGIYKIDITARDYTYPSRIVVSDYDKPYGNIYHGKSFEYQKGNVLNYSIPLDPIKSSVISYSSSVIKNRLSTALEVIQYVLIVVGIVLLAFSIQYGINTLDILSIISYAVIICINLIIWLKGRKNYGVVYTTSGNIASGITLVLRELEFDQIVAKRVTDDFGRYRFMIKGGIYRLEVEDNSYELLPGSKNEFKKDENRLLIVNSDLIVRSK